MTTRANPPHGNASSANPPEVLLIDANEDHLTLSALALGRQGFKVTAVASGKEGLQLALSRPFDAVVLDHKVRDASSFDILQALARRVPQTPKVFVVASGGEDQAVRALGAGAAGYLVKTARYNEVLPLEVQEQIAKVRDRARLEEQRRALESGLAERREIEEALRAFEERIGVMSEQAPFILWTMDPDLRFTSSVGSGLKSLGLRPNQVVGTTLQAFAGTDDPDASMIAAHRRALAGETTRFEQEWQGRVFDVHVEPLRRRDGPILGVFGVALDVSDRVRAERVQSALFRISQAAVTAENFRDLLRSIHGIVGELMPAGNFYIALHEPDADTLTFPYFVDEKEDPPDPQPMNRGLTEYVLRTGEPLLASPEVFRKLLASGEVAEIGPESVDWLGVPLIVGDRTFGVLVVQSYTEGIRYTEADRDLLRFVCSQIALVVDRRRAVEGLRESERALSTLMHALPGVVYRCRNDPEWTYEFVSDGCREVLGYPASALIGDRRITGRDLILPQDRAHVQAETDAAVREHRAYRIRYRIRTAGGVERWLWDQGRVIYGPDGSAVALEGIVTDVSDPGEAVPESAERFINRAPLRPSG